MAKKRPPVTEKKTSFPIFSVVAGLAFCMLAGCGGGGGTEAGGSLDIPDAIEPDRPSGTPGPPPALVGLLNGEKFSLVKARQAWFSGGRVDVYTGKSVVIGIMEEVNSFHESFQNGDGEPSKIHEASVLTSPYPTTLMNNGNSGGASSIPVPEEKFIVDMSDFTAYPDEACLLELGNPCPDNGDKYFLRLPGGEIRLLPGLRNPGEPVAYPRDCMPSSGMCSEVSYSTEHGTRVASVAAASAGEVRLQGEDGPLPFRGVAYGARILVYARPLNIAGVVTTAASQAAYFRNAPKEADVYNYSHSSVMPVTSNDPASEFAAEARDRSRSGLPQIADGIREMGRPFIASAGNNKEVFPRFPAALPLFFPDLRGQVLAVTAIDDDGRIASYANRCGGLPSDWVADGSAAGYDGRHYCLAAPGGDSAGKNPFFAAGPENNGYGKTSGTSLAAPVVAGAFAILKERFRGNTNMNDRQLVFRLVDTADNRDRTGEGGEDYSDATVYGAGLLDLEAAIMPVGTQRMSAAGDINEGIAYDFGATLLSTSAAFGDALQRALQTHEVAAFDELDAPFWHPLVSITATTSSRETLQERHAHLFENDSAPVETMGGGRLALVSTGAGSSGQIDMSLRQPVDIPVAGAELLFTAGDLSTSPLGLHDDKSFAHPYLGFAGEGVGLGGSLQLGAGRLTAMGFTSGSASISEDVPVDARGGLIEYALEPLAGVALGVQAGAMVEESRALGLLSEGGFGEMGESSTAFAGVSLDGTLEENWRFRASMHFGRTNLDVPSAGLLTGSSALSSSAFRFALEGSDVLLDADRIDVFVAQPLRIEGGEADFTVPVGRTPSGLVRRERISGVSLEPGGRELEFGTRYEVQVREDIVATGGLGIVHEGGHSKRQETEFYGLANLRFHF